MANSTESALSNAHTEYSFPINKSKVRDLELTLTKVFPKITKILLRVLKSIAKTKSVKVQLSAEVSLEKYNYEQRKNISFTGWFPSSTKVLLTTNQLDSILTESLAEIIGFYDSFVQKGSGWCLKEVQQIKMTVVKFTLFAGGCANVKLPQSIIKKRSCIIIKDIYLDKCFLYGIAAGLLNLKRNPQRKKHYENLVKALPHSFVSFPMNQRDILKFEKKTHISVNVYALDKTTIFPYRITNEKNKRYHVNLLLYKGHYFTIRNMSALLSGQTKSNKTKSYVCDYCLSTFVNTKRFMLHNDLCQKKGQRFQMPAPGTQVKFTRFNNLTQANFIIYADIESLCEKETPGKTAKLISQSKHIPISVGAIRVCRPAQEFSSDLFMYTGLDCIQQLYNYLEREFVFIQNILRSCCKPITMTAQDEHRFQQATQCNACKISFSDQCLKYRDHCHLSGAYRHALCNLCNLNRANTGYKVYVFFHGLSNYDSHFLIDSIYKYNCNLVNIIPISSEQYLTFSVGNLEFKDTYKFMSERLAELARILRLKGDEHFTYLNRHFTEESQRKLVRCKGVFPYSYMTSVDVLFEKCLPPKEAFFNDLTQQPISDEQYNFALKVFEEFKCTNLLSYLHVYLSCDVLLLADIFEHFRSDCIKDYELDPAHYFSAAHFTFDAYLRKCNPDLELLSDINQYLFFRKAMRGGLSMISKRFSVANNKYMHNYDPSKPSKYIIYLDANNLYGWAMSQLLPNKSFEWMSEGELNLEFVMSIPHDSNHGCFVEVDIYYPEHLHDQHADYPLAPEKMKISYDQLSPHAKILCNKFGLKKSTNSEKLMCTFLTKYNYVLHYKLLQFYVNHGLQVLKIHRGVKFEQAPVMRPYIEFNSKKRARATTDFESTVVKLLSNALYGKTIERPEKRCKMKLINKQSKLENICAKPNFKKSKRINDNLVSVEMSYPLIKLDKPFYLGVTILELSKLYMYTFHYEFIKRKYGSSAKLLFTDTDSLTYEIETEDVYKDLADSAHAGLFDFSNYPTDHPNYSSLFKRVPGCFKDETASCVITCYVGLRSKMYSFIIENSILKLVTTERKVAKGVKKCVIDKSLSYADYLKCLNCEEQTEHTFNTIRSIAHQVFTNKQTKISLSPFDDKRYLLDEKSSVPYGHYSTVGSE